MKRAVSVPSGRPVRASCRCSSDGLLRKRLPSVSSPSPKVPGQLFDEMPCIWLKPDLREQKDGDAGGTYNCPLYKTSLRVRGNVLLR